MERYSLNILLGDNCVRLKNLVRVKQETGCAFFVNFLIFWISLKVEETGNEVFLNIRCTNASVTSGKN